RFWFWLGLGFGFRMFGLTKHAQTQKHVALIGCIRQTVILAHHAAANHLFNLAIKRLHAFSLALFHRIQQRLPFRLPAFDVLAGSRSCLQGVDGGNPAMAVSAWEKPLRDDKPKRLCQARPDDLLLVLGEYANDS